MKCSYCAKEIDEIDVYCRWCGKPVATKKTKKPYSLLALIFISSLIAINLVGIFVDGQLFLKNILFLVSMILISSALLALSIIGIVYSVSCKRRLGNYYGLAKGIVACSLSGCFILFEIICILLRV